MPERFQIKNENMEVKIRFDTKGSMTLEYVDGVGNTQTLIVGSNQVEKFVSMIIAVRNMIRNQSKPS